MQLAIFVIVRKHHFIVAGIAFLICLISIYFGIKIFNANENHLITELNELDKVYYSDIKMVPDLSRLAAMIILPFVVIITIFVIIIIVKVPNIRTKNINFGILFMMLVLIVFSILTILNPFFYDFSKWGLIWICLGLLTIVGSAVSFIQRRGEKV